MLDMKPVAADDAFGVCLLVAVLVVLGVLAFVDIPKENVELFTAIASGVIGASFVMWCNYRWGSSRGSAAKDVTIATMANDAAPDGEKK